MLIIETIAEIREVINAYKAKGQIIAFVPTMGYLHEGHLTLMREAKKACDVVVVSIFVNPLQFGVGEDYEEYPRDLSRDSELAESAGVDVIFAPKVKEMYPKGYNSYVEVFGLTDKLCGQSRPGHFKGVTTVVNKLFNIVAPHKAFFGQKDAQQVLVIKKMVSDLNMDLEIITVPIVREKDGLAMSSRNVYLTPEERNSALVLSKSLSFAKEEIAKGLRDKKQLQNKIISFISQETIADIDYVEILNIPNLEEQEVLENNILIALAVRFGKTRLIDNMVVEVK